MSEKHYNFALREDQTFVKEMVEAFRIDKVGRLESLKEYSKANKVDNKLRQISELISEIYDELI